MEAADAPDAGPPPVVQAADGLISAVVRFIQTYGWAVRGAGGAWHVRGARMVHRSVTQHTHTPHTHRVQMVFLALAYTFLRPRMDRVVASRARERSEAAAREPARVRVLERDRRRVREQQQARVLAASEEAKKKEVEKKRKEAAEPRKRLRQQSGVCVCEHVQVCACE